MIRALIALVALFFLGAPAFAQVSPTDHDVGWDTPYCSDNADPDFTGYCMSPAGRLEYTLHAFQLRRADTHEMVTIAAATRTFDFASVAANTQLGEYASDIRVPYGTYDALGFMLGIDTVFTGQTNGGAAGDCAITATGFSTNLANAAPRTIDGRAMGLEYDNEAVVVDGNKLQGIDDEATGLPLTVAPGDVVSFNMSVSAGRGVWYYYQNGVCIDAGPYGPRVRTGFSLS